MIFHSLVYISFDNRGSLWSGLNAEMETAFMESSQLLDPVKNFGCFHVLVIELGSVMNRGVHISSRIVFVCFGGHAQ